MRRLIVIVTFFILGGLLWQEVAAQPVAPTQTPRLDYFPSLPKAIDGCSGTYTYDSVALKKERYIFVENLQELAFLYVSGKEIALNKIKSLVLPGGKKTRTEYQGSGYTVILIVREVKQTGDEVTYLEGTLEVKYGQTSLSFKIHGEAAC
jgi:hypothetical protein